MASEKGTKFDNNDMTTCNIPGGLQNNWITGPPGQWAEKLMSCIATYVKLIPGFIKPHYATWDRELHWPIPDKYRIY